MQKYDYYKDAGRPPAESLAYVPAGIARPAVRYLTKWRPVEGVDDLEVSEVSPGVLAYRLPRLRHGDARGATLRKVLVLPQGLGRAVQLCKERSQQFYLREETYK